MALKRHCRIITRGYGRHARIVTRGYLGGVLSKLITAISTITTTLGFKSWIP
jgi:hypothetical protein